ncbi:MAG: hypothetical protein ER33_04025 [Cyanobium sp. CACIAM 14]|nr:MAG: hypothetical protein ER33_04025 [Cyanobium sp. CACIAM 14]
MVHLVASLEPNDARLQNRRDAFARWAVGAAVGFLLLLPLQAVSAYQGVELVVRSQSSALKVALERAYEFRQAIDRATSIEDLQERIARLQGPGLRLTDTGGGSLGELKKVLTARLEVSVRNSRNVIQSPWNPNLWAIAQRSIRVLLLALVYGVAFAAGSQRRGSDLPLLREAQMRWDLAAAKRAEWRRERLEDLEERRRQFQQRREEAMEARTKGLRERVVIRAEAASAPLSHTRALPADMAYFHQLSVEGEDPERQEPS